MSDVTCHHTAEEIREMAYLVWLKDQTTLIEQALSEEALDALTEEKIPGIPMTSWRINPSIPVGSELVALSRTKERLDRSDGQGEIIGVLVPDLRLQAIKDAPRCKHGRIDEHRFRLICYHVTYKACRESARCWCDGAPRLRSLLEDDDE